MGVEEEEHGELLLPNYWCELVPALNMGPRLFVDTGEVLFRKDRADRADIPHGGLKPGHRYDKTSVFL